ncbi:hypothetical protein FACS1894176_00710 [Bacteroidia bacterium]|nr:hypothetical protein FACS1894176_00710 [Bacteroidia bacterium]
MVTNVSLVGRGLSTYWRRDKLEGIETQAAEKIKPALSNTLSDITKLAKGESLTLDTILKSLKKKFNKETDSELLAFASDVYTALNPYEKVLKEPDSPAKQRVIDQLTDMMTLHWLNTNKAELADSPAYLSGAALGAQFVAGWLPMPTGGISFTKFKNLYYTDDEASFNRQKETLKKGYGADTLENISFGQLATNLNITLKRKYESATETKEGETPSSTPDFLEYDELNSIVKINKKLMGKVNLHILPELKQFVAQDGENLYIPARIPVSFVNRIDSKKTDFHLVIGSKGMGNTEFVSPNTSFDPEKGFKPYDAVKFAQDWVDVPAEVIAQGKMEMIALTKEYLSNVSKRAQQEKRLQNACKHIPSITALTIPVNKITDQNFVIQITFNGEVKEFPVEYNKLGKIQYKKALNNAETLDFVA